MSILIVLIKFFPRKILRNSLFASGYFLTPKHPPPYFSLYIFRVRWVQKSKYPSHTLARLLYHFRASTAYSCKWNETQHCILFLPHALTHLLFCTLYYFRFCFVSLSYHFLIFAIILCMEEVYFKFKKKQMRSLKRTHITYKCFATRNNQIFSIESLYEVELLFKWL